MDKEEMEKIVKLFTEIQKCYDKKHAFLKGVLFGIGFSKNAPEPNWDLVKKIIDEGDDAIGWIEIEKDTLRIYNDVVKKEIDLVQSMVDELEKEVK